MASFYGKQKISILEQPLLPHILQEYRAQLIH